jgi:hypothetical protein
MQILQWKVSTRAIDQGHATKTKQARNDESKKELEGKGRSSRRTHHELTNPFLRRTPEDTRRIRDLLPSKIHGSYTNQWISLSHKHLEEETLKEKIKKWRR